MTQNSDPTSTTLPTARKSRRASQRNRPVLVSSTSQGLQEFQTSQVETLEPEIIHTEPLAKGSPSVETSEVAAKAKRSSRLPSFFSKVEKTVEEPEISQEEVVKARLARAKKTTPKAEVTPTEDETKVQDEKTTHGANRTAVAATAATPARPNRAFKTRHLIGMMIYLFGAEIILPLEANFFNQIGIEVTLAKFTLFNLPITITSSVVLNLATLVAFLLLLVKFDLLPRSMSGSTPATARAKQQQQVINERQPQQTIRQGVKGENDDLYQAYRSNQRRDKKRS
jgi:hypothetical protein